MTATPLKRTIYDHLRTKLLAGEFPASGRISELGIAKELGVSRAPVREAMHQLAGEELVELVPGMGAYVKRPGRGEMASLFDLREALEVHAVGRAARRISPRQLAILDATSRKRYGILRRIADRPGHRFEEPDMVEILASDARFHETILNAGGNRRMVRMVQDLSLLARVWSVRLDPNVHDLFAEYVQAYTCHRRIAAALRRRDSRGARHWMRRHLRATLAAYQKQMSRGD